MGQATADLPDPLDNPSLAPINSADDLLAQLAGDEVDRLLAESDAGKIEDKSPPAAVEPPPAAAPSGSDIQDVFAQLEAAEDKPSAPIDEPDATGIVERAALTGGDLSPELPRSVELELGEGGELPAFFKPLVWLNAPLDACPDGVREALGKVAVVTLVNAVAVLAYVLIFRRHH
jgi:hypothetical protein